MSTTPALPGTQLPNGATVIALAQRADGPIIYLTVTEGMHPYATWQAPSGCPTRTHWGHYHSSRSDAWQDFIERTAR